MPYYENEHVSLYHGDCREIMPALGVSAHAVITDPPYAISVVGAAHVAQRGKGTRRLDFFPDDSDWQNTTAMVRDAMSIACACLTATGSVYAWVGHRMMGQIALDMEARGMSTRFIVWAKKHPPPAPPGSGWPSGAELCLYAYPPGRTWVPRGRESPRSNVIVADGYRHGTRGKLGHPTQKPESVIMPLVEVSTRHGDLILDPFAGSGTTLAVARRAGRRAVGIEIDERYCEMAAKRLMSQEDVT